MADAVRLTPTSYVVLGVVALRGPTTSYELGRYAEGSIDHFWPIPHAQLYREPKRLADAGLLSVEEEDGGRRRQFFSLTADGRTALDAWLAGPAEDVLELRDAGLVKLHFSTLMDPGARRALAAEQADRRAARLARYEELVARYGGDQPSLRLGIALEKAALAFWESLGAED